MNPHDTLFKFAFSDPTHAAGELRALLPPELIEAVDFDSLALVKGSFVDEALRERHADLLLSARLRGRVALIYVLFEHQSTVDELMPFRMLVYVTRIWERWVRDHRGARRLPLVVPLVLHHGDTGWTGPTRLAELVDLDPVLLETVHRHVPDFEMLVDDLASVSDEALASRAMTAYARVVLWSLRSARSGALSEIARAMWRLAFEEFARSPREQHEALGVLLRYLLQVSSDERHSVLEAILAEDVGDRVKEEYVTLYESILKQGEERGRKEGEERGRKEGEERGRAAIVLRLLEKKFGALSAEARARVEQSDAAALERLAERVLEAATLDELWRDA